MQPSDAPARQEHFSCVDCLPPPARRKGLELDPVRQQGKLCVLPGFDTSTHRPRPITRVWLGRGPDRANEGKTPDWSAPNEPIAEMGCPGAWYRTDWIDSLRPYMRRRDEAGGRVDNPALAQCRDPLVLEAIQLLEAFEDAAVSEYRRLAEAKRQADAELKRRRG